MTAKQQWLVVLAESDDAVLITGSLYVVGGARPYLRKVL